MRCGVFGGTFDPPHLGHLILAAEAADQLRLDKILWVITPDPPHKLAQGITPLPIRLELLEAALRGEPNWEISRVDIERPGPQYAADTIALLALQYPGTQLFYLIGGDSLHDLPDWYAPDRLIGNVSGIGVMRRPGDLIDLDLLDQRLPGLKAKLHWVDSPLLEISSRDLRERVRTGRHYRHFLPETVWELIKARNLYAA